MSPFRFQPAEFLEAHADPDVYDVVRNISREDFPRHENPEFRIGVLESRQEMYDAFADDLVGTIAAASNEDRRCVVIVPAGPMPQYHVAARIINNRGLRLDHVDFFAMDEWADDDGASAPASWEGSFQYALRTQFFARIDPELRPREDRVHFPTSADISAHGARIADLGGADVCYGGIGWNGHIAFWEPHLAAEFDGDMNAYRAASSRLVRLHPTTILQNALTSFGGDWSNVPPQAVTIGPAQILGARRRSFWLDGDLGNGVTWQGFIARLVAHGPVTGYVPGSLLQTARTDFTVLEAIAAPLSTHIN